MKWNNIGHELDDFINFYDLDINKDLSVFAYGDEAYGKRLYEYGRHRNLVEGYIVDDLDNNILLKQDTKNTLTYSEFLKKNMMLKLSLQPKEKRHN